MGHALIALALLGCAAAPPPDVILITLDTTRSDRLGAYGYGEAHTETIDALAAAGRRYDRAYSPVPLTIPAHSAIMTGRYPADLGVRGNGDSPLPDEAVTLAEVLKENGYVTGASVAAFVTTKAWGFSQGFDSYFDTIPKVEQNLWHSERRGDAVVDDAISWWQAQPADKPHFLWVHLYDAHFPYQPPKEALDRAGGRPYDGELAFVDDQVARLVEATKGRDVLWVLVGDHGEGLGDHGELTHGLFVYESTQRVPFIVSGHGVAAETVQQPVSLVDVMPTVLGLAGLKPPPGIYGRSVPAAEARPIYMDAWSLRDRFGLSPHVGVIDGSNLLIDVPRPELYDVVADHQQTNDLSANGADRIATMKQTLSGFGFGPPVAAARGVADPGVAAQLAALGYTEGTFSGDPTAPLPDPKDHKGLIKLSQRAERLDMEEKYDEAIAVYQELLAQYHDILEFRNRLAIDLERVGRRTEAIAVLREALAKDPENDMVMGTLAAFLARDGQHHEAAELFVKCAIAAPYSDRTRHAAMMATLADGRPQDAITLGLGWIQQYPEDLATAGLLGLAYYRTQDQERAVPYLEQGLKAEEPPLNVAFRLSEVALRAHDTARATSLLEQEVATHPENADAVEILIKVLSDAKRWDDLAALGGSITTKHPERALFWHAWAQAQFNLKQYALARETLDRGLQLHPESSVLVLLDANLLAKEARREDGERRFAAAQALQAAGK